MPIARCPEAALEPTCLICPQKKSAGCWTGCRRHRRFAIGIDRAAVPDRLQGVDRGDDDFAARLAVDRRNEADAAGIMLSAGS